MEIYFHTIALEPARWTPRKVSRPLSALLPGIAAAGFQTLEIYEPHLRESADWPAIRSLLKDLALRPEILSSYLNIATLSGEDFAVQMAALEETITFFGFSRVRLFPGAGISPDDAPAVAGFVRRLAVVAERLRGIEILLETHDNSIADSPEKIVSLVRNLNASHVGLLFQPTRIELEPTLAQFALQKEWIRHVHLHNRTLEKSFVPLEQGVTPWRSLLAQLPPTVHATLEFVPEGIVPEEDFDAEAVMRRACSERAFLLGA